MFYNVRYISQLLKNMGFSYQKAGFAVGGKDPKNADKRQQWLDKFWPEALALAKELGAYLFFEDASFPVVLAKHGHRFKAKVAPELADSGYCSTKKLYFYGVRIHIVGRSQSGTLPRPEYIGVTGASHNDGKIFEQIRPFLCNNDIYGDKAYKLPPGRRYSCSTSSCCIHACGSPIF